MRLAFIFVTPPASSSTGSTCSSSAVFSFLLGTNTANSTHVEAYVATEDGDMKLQHDVCPDPQVSQVEDVPTLTPLPIRLASRRPRDVESVAATPARVLNTSLSPTATTTRKRMSFAALLALASLAVSATAHVDNAQIPLAQEQLVSYPGFDLDLSEPRIIELDDNTRRVVTELEKAKLQLLFES